MCHHVLSMQQLYVPSKQFLIRKGSSLHLLPKPVLTCTLRAARLQTHLPCPCSHMHEPFNHSLFWLCKQSVTKVIVSSKRMAGEAMGSSYQQHSLLLGRRRFASSKAMERRRELLLEAGGGLGTAGCRRRRRIPRQGAVITSSHLGRLCRLPF